MRLIRVNLGHRECAFWFGSVWGWVMGLKDGIGDLAGED